MEIESPDIFDAIRKMKAIRPSVGVALTSTTARDAAIKKAEEIYHLPTDKVRVGRTPKISAYGVDIVGSKSIESDHVFFFDNLRDAQQLISSLRNLKDIGMTWQEIIEDVTALLEGRNVGY